MEKIIQKAIAARKNAYAPYSGFQVGAAILMKNNEVVLGANIENASYSLCICAERSALFAAYNQGYKKADIVKMAVVADTEKPVSPCGACRQVMFELLNDDTPIYLANLKGDIKEVTIKQLLPYAFEEIEKGK